MCRSDSALDERFGIRRGRRVLRRYRRRVALVDSELAHTLPLGDGVVEWEAVGDGPPLIWVEGGPGIWAHLARPDVALIQDIFRCHLVNAPGCGRTSPPAEPSGYELAALIDWWERVRKALGFDRVSIMGHSWGGVVAPAWAAAHPESIERLVVINGYPGGMDNNPGIDQERAAAERERNLARHAGKDYYDAGVKALNDEEAQYESGIEISEEEGTASYRPAWPLYFSDPTSPLSAPHVRRIQDDFRVNMDIQLAWYGPQDPIDSRTNTLPTLSAVRCPTLVIAGAHDIVCGPEWNKPIARAIRDARYVEIDNAGHLPQYEQPEAVRTALLDWLTATRT